MTPTKPLFALLASIACFACAEPPPRTFADAETIRRAVEIAQERAAPREAGEAEAGDPS